MNQAPLNPDALEAVELWMRDKEDNGTGLHWKNAKPIIETCLAAAQPVVNSFDPRELNRKGWTCGCEPGDYDECVECQSACNELANFLNRPEVPGA